MKELKRGSKVEKILLLLKDRPLKTRELMERAGFQRRILKSDGEFRFKDRAYYSGWEATRQRLVGGAQYYLYGDTHYGIPVKIWWEEDIKEYCCNIPPLIWYDRESRKWHITSSGLYLLMYRRLHG